MPYFNCSLTILPLSVCMHACVLSVSVCECAVVCLLALELASYWSNGNRVSGILDISDEQLSRLLAG